MHLLIAALWFWTGLRPASIGAQDQRIHFPEQLADSLPVSPLAPILDRYFQLENALFRADPTEAAKQAAALLEAIRQADFKTLPASQQKLFVSLSQKLEYDARHISEVSSLPHQREHFASLSANVISLARQVPLSTAPIYRDYCPMKKAYWLSAQTTINNPYLAPDMSDCGKIVQTISP
jgi:hypothetical protein